MSCILLIHPFAHVGSPFLAYFAGGEVASMAVKLSNIL